jgi:hypothetical protein
MYQALVRDWRNEQVDLRHFAGPISRNLANDIPDDVVNTLLECATQRRGVPALLCSKTLAGHGSPPPLRYPHRLPKQKNNMISTYRYGD